MELRTHGFKLCSKCNDYTEHWKILRHPEWHCSECGEVFVPKRGRI